MHNKNQDLGRWQALDIIKTTGLLAALSFHILIWWFGKNWGGAGAVFYSFNAARLWLMVAYLVIIHLIFVSAGAAFYFYLKKYKSTSKKIFFRIVLFVLLGVLFGLNFSPLVIFWNVFLFYAFSILIIFIIDRYGGKKTIIFLTLGVLALTPLLRLFLNKIIPRNYLSAILVGDPQGSISFYPFFPWFFLVGAGFLTSYFYSEYQSKRFLSYGLFGGIIIFFLATPFLKPLDLSNIFGNTSHMPIGYIIIIFSVFIFLISLLELALKETMFSKYNPAVAIGRHILPVYLITIVVTLPLTDAFKNSAVYGNSIYIFLILELITFITAYLSGTFLTYWFNKRAQ